MLRTWRVAPNECFCLSIFVQRAAGWFARLVTVTAPGGIRMEADALGM